MLIFWISLFRDCRLASFFCVSFASVRFVLRLFKGPLKSPGALQGPSNFPEVGKTRNAGWPTRASERAEKPRGSPEKPRQPRTSQGSPGTPMGSPERGREP